MAIKLKIPRSGRGARSGAARKKDITLADLAADPRVRAGLAVFIIGSVLLLSVFAYYYIKYQKIVDARMSGQIFESSAQIYAAPRVLELGDPVSVSDLERQLVHAGYSPEGVQPESRLGTFRLLSGGIEIKPGPESYHSPDGAIVRVAGGKVDKITGLGSMAGKDLAAYELEPQLITGLSDSQNRGKRRVITYDDIPKVLVDATIAIEDRRFFQHSGINYFRFAEAALVDLRQGRRGQGGSTITMQIARQPGFFLGQEKTIKRKLTEMLIALQLEQRFNKQQIFTLYANSVNLGQRGSFGINGFGEAARAYFNKDIKEITLPEAALLAGLIQRPSYLSPYRHPERALDRRNLVLDSMVETGAITRDQAEKAKATPLKLAPPNVEASDAPYFVDLVKETLNDRYNERDMNAQQYRIYTTLDLDLQKAAAEAVEIGVRNIDEQVAKLRTRRVKGASGKMETKVREGPQAQVALVAIDPHTGEVLALVGGRNYGMSQLNHAVARRPTGSIFKPFVYAAAVNTAVNAVEGQPIFTPTSMLDDSPTTFTYGDQIYEPRNYKEEYHGPVTARYALAYSLNNATVKLAEAVGYEKVADLARAAGIVSVKPTPAMALGAYEATPLDMAGAYTVFANGGTRVAPSLVRSVRDARANVIEDTQPKKTDVLDPRVAYVMTSMMENVINAGLGSGVRARGFTAPAAGKTGTSHDAWFAGYTSNIICIVWVGNDDYTDVKLSGSAAAVPIWAEFMKRAQALPQYRDMKYFTPPEGIVTLTMDKATNRIATPACPDDYTAAFISGTEPHDTCEQTASASGLLDKLGRLVGLGRSGTPAGVVPPPPPGSQGQVQAQTQPGTNGNIPKPATEDSRKKKGFFGKIFGVFKSDDSDKKSQPPQQQPGGTSPPPN